DADAIGAETMTIAWTRLSRVPRDDPRPWLLATARNLLLHELRRRGREAAHQFDPERDGHSVPAFEADALDPGVAGALRALSPARPAGGAMSTDRALARLRAANPVPAQPIEASALFARIVVGPGDPRAARPATRGRRRPLVLGAVALGLVGAGTAAGVLANDPLGIFRENPAWGDAAGQWPQDVLPDSIVLARSLD